MSQGLLQCVIPECTNELHYWTISAGHNPMCKDHSVNHFPKKLRCAISGCAEPPGKIMIIRNNNFPLCYKHGEDKNTLSKIKKLLQSDFRIEKEITIIDFTPCNFANNITPSKITLGAEH